MIDVLQIVLVMVATTVTVLTVLIGVQVFNILKEVRQITRRVNEIIDDFGQMAESVTRPISSLAETLTGASGLTGLIGWFLNRRDQSREEDEKEEG